MATEQSTSLGTAIREGPYPWYFVIPLAIGWLLYVPIALVIATGHSVLSRATSRNSSKGSAAVAWLIGILCLCGLLAVMWYVVEFSPRAQYYTPPSRS